jgi:hypothetical protein
VPKSSRKTSKTKTLPYDVAEQLRTPEEMAAYLDAWLTEAPADIVGIVRALGDIDRANGISQAARADSKAVHPDVERISDLVPRDVDPEALHNEQLVNRHKR